jgi:hypothetical protein
MSCTTMRLTIPSTIYKYIVDNLKLNNEHNSEGPLDHERKRINFVLESYTYITTLFQFSNLMYLHELDIWLREPIGKYPND